MIRAILILVFYNAFLISINGQIKKGGDKLVWLKADIDFENAQYSSALEGYRYLYSIDSTNQSVNFNLGQCLYFLKYDDVETEKYFLKTNAYSYPESNFYIGMIRFKLREYKSALTYLDSYKKIKLDKRIYTNETVDIQIRKILTAEKFESNYNPSVQIQNLGDKINSKYPDYAPLINYNNDELLFTSRRNDYSNSTLISYYDNIDKVYKCYKSDSGWTSPVKLSSVINTNVHNAGTSLSFDGNKLMFYRASKESVTGNIYESIRKDTTWSTPKKIGFKLNSESYTEPSACYSKDEDIIFFASDRPGGYGGKDIYYIKKLPNGTWGEPFNLGPTINTEFNEDGPFLHPISSQLYFSSEGHENMGGYDVFVSNFNEKGEFEQPKNLGYPVNSSANDIFFTLNYNFSEGYLSSDRVGGYGLTDIYRLEFKDEILPYQVYSILVEDDSNKILKNVEVTLYDKIKKEKLGIYKSNIYSGKVLIISEPKMEVEMEIKYLNNVVYKSSFLFNDMQQIIISLN